MASATYRIGPSDLFLPSDLKADADTLDGQVQDLDAMVEGNDTVDPGWLDQWMRFQGNWAAFYYQDFSGGELGSILTALNDSNRDQLVSYENQFQSLLSASGQQLANNVQPSKGSSGLPNLGLPSLGDVTTLVVAVIVLIIAWEVLK